MTIAKQRDGQGNFVSLKTRNKETNTAMPEPVSIKPGQVWRDKDRRREEDGTVRTFQVVRIDTILATVLVMCRSIDRADKTSYHFKPTRFGSGRSNDSFELVEDVANA